MHMMMQQDHGTWPGRQCITASDAAALQKALWPANKRLTWMQAWQS